MPVRERSHFQLSVCVLLSYDQADNVFDIPSLDFSFVNGNKLVSTLYLPCDQQICVSCMRSDMVLYGFERMRLTLMYDRYILTAGLGGTIRGHAGDEHISLLCHAERDSNTHLVRLRGLCPWYRQSPHDDCFVDADRPRYRSFQDRGVNN